MRTLSKVALVLAAMLLGDRAEAQKPEDMAVIAVIDDSGAGPVALRWFLADRAAVHVVMHTTGSQRNLILMRKSRATSGLLAEAIHTLLEAQAKHGRNHPKVYSISIHGDLGNARDAEVAALFQRVRSASPVEVRGVGLAPALTIRLTPKPKDVQTGG